MNKQLISQINDNNFDEYVLKDKKNFILVDFWAEWCSPCKMLSPILEDISQDYENKLIILKLNIDKNPLTAPKYHVRSIPTIILFKQGKLLQTKIGLHSKNEIKQFLKKYLD